MQFKDLICDVCVGNNLDEELEGPGCMQNLHSEPTFLPDVPGYSDGVGSSDDYMMPKSSLPYLGVLIINHIS